jgi:hypothetical protein
VLNLTPTSSFTIAKTFFPFLFSNSVFVFQKKNIYDAKKLLFSLELIEGLWAVQGDM